MDKKIQIWRLHNEFMGGPYAGKGNIYDYIAAHAESSKRLMAKRPVPWKDEGLSQHFQNFAEFRVRTDLVSGFKGLSAYSRWFSSGEFQNACDATGFFLTRYRVDAEDVILGDKQVLFKPDSAVITAFRRCNQPGVMQTRADVHHKPIMRFLKNTDLACDMT